MNKTVSTWVLTVPLVALFLFAGGIKFSAEAAENFQKFGYSDGFRVFIGIAELAGALGLIVPRLAFWAASGLVIIMAGAVYTHLANELPPTTPAITGLLLAVVATLRYRGALLLSPAGSTRGPSEPAAVA